MRNVSSYDRLNVEELREELVVVTSVLAGEYEQLGMQLADYHREYLTDYARSPGSSATAKNREAQYANMEAGTLIMHGRAKINSLTLCRDLLVYLLLSKEPGATPYPGIARMDDDGLSVV